jgi:hypothetical protein
VQHFNEERSDASRVDDLSKLEELCKAVVIQSAKDQQAMRLYYAWNVSYTAFRWEILYYEKSR